jgi:hypothetical protein
LILLHHLTSMMSMMQTHLTNKTPVTIKRERRAATVAVPFSLWYNTQEVK